MIAVFNQYLTALADNAKTFSREYIQWLQTLVLQVNFLTGVAVVPPKGIVWANISAADIAAYFTTGLGNEGDVYEGWAICNGSNGTPNLADRFVRAKATGAGATGGSDSSAHTHAVDHDHGAFTSAAESGHTHAIDHDHASFTSGSHTLTTSEIPAHTHAAGTLSSDSGGAHTHGLSTLTNNTAGAVSGFGPISASVSKTSLAASTDSGGSHSHTVSGSTASAGSDGGHTHAVDPPALTGTSGASSGHTHSIDVPALTGTSGAASASENRPAYYELVPLMRVWT